MEKTDQEIWEEIQKLPWHEFQSLYESAESEDDRHELIIIRGQTDFEFFAYTFFQHYCTRPFNDYHRYTFAKKIFGQRGVREADAAPRGSAKSTITSLIEPLHDVCYGLENFILLLSSTTPLANKKLKDIRMEVQSNDLLAAVYGLRFPKKKVGESEFSVISDAGTTYFAAVGRGSEVRGIRVGPHRPTKVIADDVEHSDDAYSERTRKKTYDWYFEDVGKVGDTGTNFKFIGTVLHPDSLLSNLLRNPGYTGKLFKSVISWSEREDLWEDWRKLWRDIDNPDRIRLADEFFETNKDEMLRGTQVLWPEKESYLDLMKDLEEIGRRAFFKERQNEPIGEDDAIFTKIHYYREAQEMVDGKLEKGFKMEESGKFIPMFECICLGALDPSTGQEKKKKTADYSVNLIAYKHVKTGRVFVHADSTKVEPPTKFITGIFNFYDLFLFEKYAVETNLFRNLLLPNIIDEQKRRKKEGQKYEVVFYEVVNTENKRERIYRLEPKVTHGHICFNRNLSPVFMNMIKNYPNTEHDDAPDAVELVWNLANNRYKPAPMSLDAIGSV